MSHRNLKIAVILICILALFIPFPTTVVPTWKLRVVDVEGNPCANKQVNEGWGHYSLEIIGDVGGSEYRFTDSSGYVEFPKRIIYANLIWRIVAPVIAYASVIAHGSVGIDAYVFSTGMKDGPFLNYKPGKPLPDKIIVDRCKIE